MGKILLSESDLAYMVRETVGIILSEGVRYVPNGNGTIDARIDSSREDSGNTEVDTRIWGSKHDVLHGDGTGRKNIKPLYRKNDDIAAARVGYEKILNLLDSGVDRIDLSVLDDMPNGASKSAFVKRINDFNNGDLSADELLVWARNSYDRTALDSEINQNKVDRFNALQDGERGFRYDIGMVPDTNVEFISLYRMNDFNFSDVAKHGEFRQNGLTDKYLGINKADRGKIDKLYGKGKASLRRIPATYDGGLAPDVANNFSLGADTLNPDAGHFKKQYGFEDKNYTSFTQFMDKSVIYAARVLKEIDYQPNVIIAPPSSSKYNHYYCTNLSRKLGIPYIPDFYERNVIDVKCDEEGMRNAGMSEKHIFAFKTKVKNEIAAEISLIVSEPMMKLANMYPQLFSDVRKRRGVNYDFQAIRTVLCQMSANALVNHLKGNPYDELYKQICFKLSARQYGGGTIKNPDIEKRINEIVHSRAVMRNYQQALAEMHNRILMYEKQLTTGGGIKLNVASKKFKVTDFDKRERKFLSNVYVVASKNLDENGQLLDKLANANFLIFDEDMNSGATLKLSIDALLDKLPQHNPQQIKCLVNCYSSGGR